MPPVTHTFVTKHRQPPCNHPPHNTHNPTQANIATLQAEVGKHEPHLALDGGPGAGVRVLVPVYQAALDYLAHDGMLVLETNGKDQAEALQGQMQGYQKNVSLDGGKSVTAKYASVEVVHDLFCVPRFVVAHAAHG